MGSSGPRPCSIGKKARRLEAGVTKKAEAVLVVAGAVDDGDGVREKIGESVEGFDGAFGAAG